MLRKLMWVIGGILLSAAISLPGFAEEPKFQVSYRQGNVVSDGLKTKADVLINVVNLSGDEARDLTVSIPVANKLLLADFPAFVGSIPDGHQIEILQQVELPNYQIDISVPDAQIAWRVEYTNAAGERANVEVLNEKGI